MALHIHRFPDTDTLDAALAATVAARLAAGIAERGAASLVVSGGTTPHGLYRRLANTELPWDRVTITLADERWVPAVHEDSNEGMVLRLLLQDRAAAARFVPLYHAAPAPWSSLTDRAAALAALPRPFDAVLLGMGRDGHTASLFPATDTAPPPDNHTTDDVIGVHPTQAPHDRISLTPAALLDARLLVLHLTGAEKWKVLCDALKPGPAEALPVRHVLHQDRVPCHVYWAG